MKYKANLSCNQVKVINNTYIGKNCAIALTKNRKTKVYELDSIKSE